MTRPWHWVHQSQHPARWGSEIRSPDTNNSKAKAAKAPGRDISRHEPSPGYVVLNREVMARGHPPSCHGAVGDTQTPCCSVLCVLLVLWLQSRFGGWQRTMELRSKEKPGACSRSCAWVRASAPLRPAQAGWLRDMPGDSRMGAWLWCVPQHQEGLGGVRTHWVG